jgi:hypothetical protein
VLTKKEKPGVNFTNILRADFYSAQLLCAHSLCSYLKNANGEKAAHKMLVIEKKGSKHFGNHGAF